MSVKKELSVVQDGFTSQDRFNIFEQNMNISRNELEQSIIRELFFYELDPAPSEWNHYKPLSDDLFEDLRDSIESHGILHPVVVWQQHDSSYMILSGHNRIRAVESLFEEERSDGKVKCVVFPFHSLTKHRAMDIIYDGNIQRSLSFLERAQTIVGKLRLHKNDYEEVSKQCNMSVRSIKSHVNILKNVQSELIDLVDKGVLPLRECIRISSMSKESQKALYNIYHSFDLSSELFLLLIKQLKEPYLISPEDIYTQYNKTIVDLEQSKEAMASTDNSTVSITVSVDVPQHFAKTVEKEIQQIVDAYVKKQIRSARKKQALV